MMKITKTLTTYLFCTLLLFVSCWSVHGQDTTTEPAKTIAGVEIEPMPEPPKQIEPAYELDQTPTNTDTQNDESEEDMDEEYTDESDEDLDENEIDAAFDDEEESEDESQPSHQDLDRVEYEFGHNKSYQDKNNKIIFNFKNAKLHNLIKWMEQVHKVTFIPDDIIKNGTKQSIVNVADHKITFSTHKPLSKRDSWNLFVTFLDLAKLAVVPGHEKHFYRITSAEKARHAPLPTYIDIDPCALPNNDAMVRYVYILKNTTSEQMASVLTAIKRGSKSPGSTSASHAQFKELDALIFTDKASYIKSVMKIVLEFDKASLPETLRVIPLKHAAAEDIIKLYKALTKEDVAKRPFPGPKKEPTLFYFPENVTVLSELRTNAIIVIGPHEAVQRVEKFIRTYVDKEVPATDSPLRMFQLQNTNATQMADILNRVTQFAPESPASQHGGIRGGEKYFKTMHFEAEKSGNRLVAHISNEDLPHIEKLIRKLDVMQKQVALEVLIVNVKMDKKKQLGAQIRNKDSKLINKHVNFQTSGLPSGNTAKGIVADKQKGLLANLIGLATGHGAGSTLISLGKSTNIWGILKMLQTRTQAHVISNPFLITTNKFEASVSTGEIRRVKSSIITNNAGTNVTEGSLPTKLEVKINPRINDNDIINLQIVVTIQEFTDASGEVETAWTEKTVITNANLGNKEVLALGGLIQNKERDSEKSTPLLGRIPVLGWLFKNKSKTRTKDNLIIFISPRIIKPETLENNIYTQNKKNAAIGLFESMKRHPSDQMEPIHRWFFKDNRTTYSHEQVDEFMEKKYMGISQKKDAQKESSPKKDETSEKKSKKKTPPKNRKKRSRSLASFMNNHRKGSSHD